MTNLGYYAMRAERQKKRYYLKTVCEIFGCKRLFNCDGSLAKNGQKSLDNIVEVLSLCNEIGMIDLDVDRVDDVINELTRIEP